VLPVDLTPPAHPDPTSTWSRPRPASARVEALAQAPPRRPPHSDALDGCRFWFREGSKWPSETTDIARHLSHERVAARERALWSRLLSIGLGVVFDAVWRR
jgi:hypothetical protein